jgi:hypothetical protein
MMGKVTDNLFKWGATVILVGVLLLWVVPTIFWTLMRVFFEVIILVSWSFIGYIFIKALENVWKVK